MDMDLDAHTSQDLTAVTERMKRLAGALLGNPHDAEDAAQEAWCLAIERKHQPRDSDAWLGGLARNFARHHRRAEARRKRRETQAARAPGATTEQVVGDHLDAAQRLLGAVSELRQPYRSAVVLQYLVGLSPAEAAEADDVSGPTHRSRVHRGLEQIRQNLSGDPHTQEGDWRKALAPLAKGAAGLVLGGAVLSKTSAILLCAVLLLLLGGGATIWLQRGDATREETTNTAADGASRKADAPQAPALAGAPQAPPPPAVPATPVGKSEEATGVLTISVQDKSGRPASFANLVITLDAGPGATTRKEQADEAGTLQVELPPGSYWAEATCEGFVRRTGVTNVRSGQEAHLKLTLDRTVALRGAVVSKQDGRPIPNAAVEVLIGGSAGGRTVIQQGMPLLAESMTSSTGTFQVNVPGNVLLTVRVRAKGMAEGSLSLASARDAAELEFQLAAGGEISGRVLDVEGKACVGARIFGVPADEARMLANPRLVLGANGGSFWSNNDDGGGSGEFEGEGPILRAHRATTDASGRYRLTHLPMPGRLRILAEAPDGSRGGTGVLTVEAASPVLEVDVQLQARAVLTVHVLDPNGEAKTSSVVTLEGVSARDGEVHFLEPKGTDSWCDFTGAQGQAFRFAGLAIGSYEVVVSGPAGDEVRSSVEIERGGEKEITVRVKSAPKLHGVVVDAQGKPVSAASVQWGRANQQTSDDGRFELEGPGDLDAKLEASSNWHAPTSVTPPQGEAPLRIVLKPRPLVVGRLIPAEGGESLRDHIWVAETGDGTTQYRVAKVDDGGKFRYPIQSEEQAVSLLLLPRGAADALLGTFHLDPEQQQDVGDVALSLGRSVKGRVFDATGKPLAGAIVRAGRPGMLEVRDGMFVSAPEATTNAEGRYEIKQVHHGRLSLRVRHASHAQVLLEEALPTDQRITMRPGAFVDGVVLDRDGQPAAGLMILAHEEMPMDAAPGTNTHTDGQGRFRLGPLASGACPFAVYRGAERIHLERIEPSEGKTIEKDIILR